MVVRSIVIAGLLARGAVLVARGALLLVDSVDDGDLLCGSTNQGG